MAETGIYLADDILRSIKSHVMERGVITFLININTDILDAAVMIRILEEHQGEKIADLEEIAIRRTLIQRKEIAQL